MTLLDLLQAPRAEAKRRVTSLRSASRLSAGIVVLTLATVASSCTEKIPALATAAMRIQPQLDSFFVGRTTTTNPYSVTLLDAVGQEIKDGRPISFTSSAPAVFTVESSTGRITGVTLGTGFIRATSNGRFIEAGVKIIHPVASIQLLPGDFGFNVGTTRQLITNLYAADGTTISNRIVTWSSSNPTVVSINVGGVVTAVAEGTAILTAAVEGKSASVTATVSKEAVASVRLNPPVAQVLRVGGQLQVTATPLNSLGQPLSGRVANWFSSSPTIASVSAAGVVTALAPGQTNITAEIESRTASLNITVTEIPPISVTLSPDTFQLATGVTRQLFPVVIDSLGRVVQNFNNRQVVWLSSNVAVASVNATGVVSGTGAGSARISVTVDGLRSNDVVVQVSQQVATITLTPFLPQILRIGGTLQMTATPKDNNGQVIQGKTVNWFSNNPTIASVSASGVVTALAVGSTSITAEIDGKTQALSFTITLVPIGSVTYTPSSDTLVAGDVKQYNAVVKDTAGRVITTLVGRSVTTQTTNSPVATLSAGGVVNTSSPGVAVLVLTVDGVASNNLTITVSQIATVTVSPSAATVATSATLQLTTTLRDASGNVLKTTKPISWTSNAQGIATVSPAGVVTGVAAGQATISAQINGVIGQAIITVP
ncbi:MAG: Ig-like domain-containing protein [Gemmatimonadaceae bacterium]